MKAIKIRAEQILDYCKDEGGQYGRWSALSVYQRTFLKAFATDILEYIKSTDDYIRQLKRLEKVDARQIRKETAEEILSIIGDIEDTDGYEFTLKDNFWFEELCQKYGVKI